MKKNDTNISKNLSTMNKALKVGTWYTVANYISKGAIFLSTPIFTRIMSEADIGAYANMNSWLQLLIPLVTFEFSTSLNLARFDYKKEFNQYMSSTLVYSSVITLLFACIALLNSNVLCDFFSVEHYAIYIMILYLLTYPAIQFLQIKNLFEYKYKETTILTLFSFLCPVFFSVLFTITSMDKLKGRVLGYYIPLAFISGIVYISILKHGRKVKYKYFKYAFSISFPLIWHSFAMHLLASGDRIIITKFQGTESNAYYSVAYNCCAIVTILWSSMNSAWSPWSTECMEHNETDKLYNASRKFVIFFSAVIFFCLLLAPELILVMGGKSYLNAIYVFPPVLVGLLAHFIYSLYVNVEFYLKKQTRIAIGTILAAILNIILNIVLVPQYGYIAAAYTTLVGYLCLFIFHFISLKLLKELKWYDNKFNCLVVLIFLSMLPAINFLYKHTIMRLFVVMLFGISIVVLVWKYRKLLIKFVRDII